MQTFANNELEEFRHYASLETANDDEKQLPISADDYPIHCNQSGAFIRNFDITTEIMPLVEIHGIAKARDILAYLATTQTLPHWLYQTSDTIPNASIMYPREHVVFALTRIYYNDKQEHEIHADKLQAFKQLQLCNYEIIRALNSALIAYLAEVNVGRYPRVPIFALTLAKCCTDGNLAKLVHWLNHECKKVQAKDNQLVLSDSYQNYVAKGTGIYKTCKASAKKKLTKNANDFFTDLDFGDMKHNFGTKTGKRVNADSPLQMALTPDKIEAVEKQNLQKQKQKRKVLFANTNADDNKPTIAQVKI